MGTAFTELRDEIKKSKIFGSYEASVRRGDLPSETRTALRKRLVRIILLLLKETCCLLMDRKNMGKQMILYLF